MTNRGRVEALIDPSDAGEWLLNRRNGDNAWDAWQTVTDHLLKEYGKQKKSAPLRLSGCGAFVKALLTPLPPNCSVLQFLKDQLP